MKKIFKALGIIFAILVFLVIVLQFTGFSIGNVSIGKQKDDLKSLNVKSFENSQFQSEILSSQKLTCINIWATWCVPCVAEMPELNKIKSEFKNKEVQFVSLSIDNDSIKLKKFIRSQKFDFTDVTLKNIKYKNAILNFLENRPLDAEISSQTVPLTYLLKNGKIVGKIDGGIESDKLKKMIAENL